MTARLSQNIRSGYLNEHLGNLLLRQLSVVAPLPAHDDIGIDAVATLLKPPQNTLQYAEGGTFGVQYKSKSVTAVPYDLDKAGDYKDQRHLEWLRQLEIPLFVGSVDKETAQLSLYTTLLANAEILTNDKIQSMRMVFAKEDAVADPFSPSIWLGPPILEWNVFSQQEDGFYENSYAVLKGWLDIERDNLIAKKLRYIELAYWKSGTVPERQGLKQQINPLGPEMSMEVLKAIRTPLRCFAFEILAKGNPSQVAVVQNVLAIAAEHGLDPDPEGLVEQSKNTLMTFQATNAAARIKNDAKRRESN